MSTLLSWLIAGIKLVVQIIVITWTTLAIYFSNLPWPALRLGLAVALAAFAIWAFWLSRRRRMPAVAIALVLGVVAWWLTIAPSGDRNWRPEVAVMPRAFIEGDHVRITGSWWARSVTSLVYAPFTAVRRCTSISSIAHWQTRGGCCLSIWRESTNSPIGRNFTIC